MAHAAADWRVLRAADVASMAAYKSGLHFSSAIVVGVNVVSLPRYTVQRQPRQASLRDSLECPPEVAAAGLKRVRLRRLRLATV